MSDLIERKAAKEAYCKKFCHPGVMCPDSGFCREVDEAFDSVPSAQPGTGHWISARDEDGWHTWLVCSECGAKETNMKAKYCPMCGRKMV